MRFLCVLTALCACCSLSGPLLAQNASGTLDLTAHITPTGGRPEPVRQFTFFVLTKSYAEIVRDVEAQDVLPSREEFISRLRISPELKTWMNAHDVMDLTTPDLDALVTADDVMQVPEFLHAYQRANSGGVTRGLPTPHFRDSDKESNPQKYEKQKQEYMAALKKFIQNNPATISGMEIELESASPKPQWDKLHSEHRARIAQLAPDTAQTRYLAAKTDTDLDGHASVSGLAPGTYWVSSLGLDASSGDRRLHWDVPVQVRAGQPARLELSNLNGIATRSSP